MTVQTPTPSISFSVSTKNVPIYENITQKRTRCEIWTRVMGYHRSVSYFNIGKKSEHFSRAHFSEFSSLNSKFSEKYKK